jgi:hypothetical protein
VRRLASGGAGDHHDHEAPRKRRASAAGESLLSESNLTEADTSAAVIPLRLSQATKVSFDRSELRLILNLYGRKVADGEWRDYAIDFLKDMAVFSVFRRTSEMPLYRIIKNPALARKQGIYSVTATGGVILKRGHDLDRVLAVLDKTLKIVR